MFSWMNNKEEQRLRDEINYLLNQREYVKSDYNFITSNFLIISTLIISSLIGLSAIIINFQTNSILLSYLKSTILFITILIFFHIAKKRYNEFRKG